MGELPVAVCFTRPRDWHRREFYVAGLKAAGFHISKDIDRRPEPDDLFLCWNRMAWDDPIARRYEKAGARVIVTENGWVGKAPDGGKMYALCLGHHNGIGSWPAGDGSRWSRLGVTLKPWRQDGRHILAICQRGFGPPEVAMPRDWPRRVADRLRRVTKRPIVVREHPGRFKDRARPLEADLEDAWAVVTWASGGAIKAIAHGIPVFHELKGWIGAGAAAQGFADLEKPFLGDRMPMFERLAWAQWSLAEIQGGEPFRRLLAPPSVHVITEAVGENRNAAKC